LAARLLEELRATEDARQMRSLVDVLKPQSRNFMNSPMFQNNIMGCCSTCGGFIGNQGNCNLSGVSGPSLRCRDCLGQNVMTWCSNNYAGNEAECDQWETEHEMKSLTADSVCVMMGKMNSLLEAFQAEIAEKYDTICLDGYESNQALVDAIREGDADPGDMDKCWANIVGNQANFGNNQWEMAYLIARQKLNIKDFLDEIFSDIETYASNTRRLDWAMQKFERSNQPWNDQEDFAEGGESGRWSSGGSALLNRVIDMPAGSTMDPCKQWLAQDGSGLRNPGHPCLAACGSSGPCNFCGTGKCCEKGNTGSGCTGEGGDERHVCIASQH